jgi:hypothetical protein
MNLLFLAIGTLSAAAYLWRRKWIDALLVLLMGGALAGLTGDYRMPAGSRLVVDAARGDVALADAVSVGGDGLRQAQWADLPARPLQWTAPDTPAISLDFPRQVALGRSFRLTVQRSKPGKARLQLLAENGQVIADAAGDTAALTVQWLPPVAERMVLKARLQDANGKTLAEGPVPLQVTAPVPLRVQGRFGAPSFDANVLHQLLDKSHALVDWQVTLGKSISRSEAPREAFAEPDLFVVDAAWFERAGAAQRSALLGQVREGASLLVMGASASDAGLWSSSLQLSLRPQAENRAAGSVLPMTAVPLNPVAAGPWASAGEFLWARPLERGRVLWIGVMEWHRHAISEPRALGIWWQGVLDAAAVRRREPVEWLSPGPMPVAGERTEICAIGVEGKAFFQALKKEMPLQRRAGRADAQCAAVWPHAAGWLDVETDVAGAQGKRSAASFYVFGKDDWPAWQSTQRREATVAYAARAPGKPQRSGAPLPHWPFALLFAAAALALWWRERR